MKKSILACAVLSLAGTGFLYGQAYAQSASPGTVNVICSTDQPWCDLAASEFRKATGIRVAQSHKGTGEALAQLRAEASNPKTDLWWGGTGDPFLQAADIGLLEASPKYFTEEHLTDGVLQLSTPSQIAADRIKSQYLDAVLHAAEVAEVFVERVVITLRKDQR